MCRLTTLLAALSLSMAATASIAAQTPRWQHAAAGVRASWYAEVAGKGIDGPGPAAEAERLINNDEKN